MQRYYHAFLIALRFCRFWWEATTKYRIHSPFILRFIQEVLEDQRIFYAFPMLGNLKKTLYKDARPLVFQDIGAPSKTNNSKQKSVGSVVRNTGILKQSGQYLFKIVQTYSPKRILELGTGAGISTLYQAFPQKHDLFVTVEGIPSLLKIAKQNLDFFGISKVEGICGNFEAVLPDLLDRFDALDYVFIDGHHQGFARQKYFELLLPKLHSESILVFSDIYWSSDMEAAWKEIQQHPKVRLSIDIFDFGVLFFNPQIKEVQHVKLVPQRWKPWILGIWS